MSKKSKAESAAEDSSKVWGAFSTVAALVAAAVAKKGLDATWKAASGKQPPANPADTEVALKEAVLWATLSGTVVAVVKMLATRRAAGYYARSTGKLPPGVNAS